MFKNKIFKYIRSSGYTLMNNRLTLDKPMASLSTVLLWMEILLNLVNYCTISLNLNAVKSC